MRKVLYVTLFFFCFLVASKAQQQYDALSERPLIEVLSVLEAKNDISFSYDNANIETEYVTVSAGTYSLQEILEFVFEQTELEFEFIDTRYILLIKRSFQHGLSYLCGYVIDENTTEPIAFATAYNERGSSGVETDDKGYFKLAVEASDRYVLISFLGYNTLKIDLRKAGNDPCVQYRLSTESISFEPVILREYLGDGISLTENANTVVIDPNAMNILPGSVEKDVLSAISFLPGITSPSESLDRIFVRGGTPDQNLILWDGIPMYHTSHFFGTISAFNPNIIDNVSVFRSGIGSQYGGRVSSVIDIQSEQEITKNFEAGVGFNLTHINFDLNIPLWKNSSLMFSTRRSITDIWNTPTFVRYAEKVFQGTRIEENNFNDPDLEFSDEFKFNDANLKWMMDYGKNKFRFTSLGALNSLNYKSNFDNLAIYSVDQLDLRNTGAKFSWERQWSNRYKTKFEFTNSEFKYDYDFDVRRRLDDLRIPIFLTSNNSITDGGLNWKNEYKLRANQDLTFGYQFTENKTNLFLDYLNEADSLKVDQNLTNRMHALYGEYALKVPNMLQLNIGLRYLYQDILQNNYFEPRIALVTNVTDRLKLKVSTGKHFQFVSQLVGLNVNLIGVNNQFWVTANNPGQGQGNVLIPVIESNQWMGGFIFQKGNWTLDVEGYVKELAGITTVTNNFFDLESQLFTSGNSRIRGIDILLKKRIKKYRTWISYSISRTKYEFPEISVEPIIASHDQTYIFNWVNLYRHKSFEFSFGVEYRSGLPASEAELVDGKIEFGTLNGIRLKRYFRMDASVIYNFGSPDNVNGFISLSLQNLGNRTNILGRSYIRDDMNGTVEPALIAIDVQGLKFTPNIAINVRMN